MFNRTHGRRHMEITQYLYEANEDWRGCLMLSLPKDIASAIREFSKNNIDDSLLTKDGKEKYIHCTVLYGFDQNIVPEDVSDFISKTFSNTTTEITLGPITRFECDGFDVIKIDVIESFDLHKMHYAAKDKFSVKTQYPIYHPHVTLAYVLPGVCKELDGMKIFDGMKVVCDTLQYSRGSSEDRTRTKINYENFKEKIGR